MVAPALKEETREAHVLEIELPGRHGKDTPTGVCSCRMWQVSPFIGVIVDGREVNDMARARARIHEAHAAHLREVREDAEAAAEWGRRIRERPRREPAHAQGARPAPATPHRERRYFEVNDDD